LIKNHPLVDGNKRVGHAAVEAFLMLNGFELNAPVDDAEREILGVTAGQRTREELEEWLGIVTK
jgi:death-on-curing protein